MNIVQSLAGSAWLELTSADPMTFFKVAAVAVYDMEKITELQYCFRVARKDVPRLRKLAKKRGETIKLSGKDGVYWALKSLIKRPVLVLGMTALLCLSLWVPGKVFFVRVEGNASVPANQIMEKAQLCGIGFGASRRLVRSEKIKNNLLSAMPELQWAGVNTYGCMAVITVRERNDPQKEPEASGISSILASRDAIVQEMTVLQGSAQVKPGQAVKAGQVLISGYTDCGIYIQANAAKGEIYGLTQREISAVFPVEYAVRREVMDVDRNFSLIIGKKRINFAKDSGISGGSCAKIVLDYDLVLPGGFCLPVSLEVQKIISYEQEPGTAEGQAVLKAFALRYLQQQMVAGGIRGAGEVFSSLDGTCRLDGVYSCYEMIGIDRKEENVLDYGKSN